MPHFEHAVLLPKPVAEVFRLFCDPAVRVQLAPPEFHLRIVHAPEQLHVGACITFKGRRWGMPQRSVLEITALEPNRLLIEEQRQGPFRHWLHRQEFESIAQDTRLSDTIDYEPPGGLLGKVVTPTRVEQDLAEAFRHRDRKLGELLGVDVFLEAPTRPARPS